MVQEQCQGVGNHCSWPSYSIPFTMDDSMTVWRRVTRGEERWRERKRLMIASLILLSSSLSTEGRLTKGMIGWSNDRTFIPLDHQQRLHHWSSLLESLWRVVEYSTIGSRPWTRLFHCLRVQGLVDECYVTSQGLGPPVIHAVTFTTQQINS